MYISENPAQSDCVCLLMSVCVVQNESELFGRTIRVNIAKPMRIKEGSSRPGEGFPHGIRFYNVLLLEYENLKKSLIFMQLYCFKYHQIMLLSLIPWFLFSLWTLHLFVIVVILTVWSDDDWLKKFSGKTTEESEEAETAAESASTNTQEVREL